jgi:hypothetical protein
LAIVSIGAPHGATIKRSNARAQRFGGQRASKSYEQPSRIVRGHNLEQPTTARRIRWSTLILIMASVEFAFHLLRSVPGIGKVLALVLLYEIHRIERFASAGDFLSYSRLVAGRGSSAGKPKGVMGRKIGNPHLKWAFSEATCLLIRQAPEAKRFVARQEKKHGKALAYKVSRSMSLLQIIAPRSDARISSPGSDTPATFTDVVIDVRVHRRCLRLPHRLCLVAWFIPNYQFGRDIVVLWFWILHADQGTMNL